MQSHMVSAEVSCYKISNSSFDRGERRHQYHTGKWVLGSKVARRARAQRATKQNNVVVPHSNLRIQKMNCCFRRLENILLGGSLTPLQHTVTRILDGQNIDFELVAHVLHKRERHSDILCVSVKKQHHIRSLGRLEPKARQSFPVLPFNFPVVLKQLRRQASIPRNPEQIPRVVADIVRRGGRRKYQTIVPFTTQQLSKQGHTILWRTPRPATCQPQQ
mmetsp:Transcript_64394/g.172384  ORF Transcript_64394/g.172384 Transcript_64394/m.172384 type:complete len:218 (+) Transcript_64394:668-1321(+)